MLNNTFLIIRQDILFLHSWKISRCKSISVVIFSSLTLFWLDITHTQWNSVSTSLWWQILYQCCNSKQNERKKDREREKICTWGLKVTIIWRCPWHYLSIWGRYPLYRELWGLKLIWYFKTDMFNVFFCFFLFKCYFNYRTYYIFIWKHKCYANHSIFNRK